MKTINIATAFSPILRNRQKAHQIRECVIDAKEKEIILDFSKVTWTSRSFMDEFVENFITNPPCEIHIANMSDLSRQMLEIVKRTHNNPVGSFVLSNPQPEIVPFIL